MLFEIYRQFQGQVPPSRIANDDDVLRLNTLIQDILICCERTPPTEAGYVHKPSYLPSYEAKSLAIFPALKEWTS